MPIRRRAWLTREGWYYVAVLAFIIGGAVLRSVNLLVVLAGAMIAPPLFNWRLVMASLMGLEVRRILPLQVLAGEPLTVEIELRNPRWWLSSWLVTVEDWIAREAAPGPQAESRRSLVAGQTRVGGDASPPRPAIAQPENFWSRLISRSRNSLFRLWHDRPTHTQALIAHVPARGVSTGAYRVTIHRRGQYRFGPLRVSTRFPLGLVRGQMTLPLPGQLVVAPRLGRFLAPWAALLDADLAGDERRHPQRGTSEGDYYGLRPWQSGDSLRWIHWRTTAKLARPVVRQYERRKSRDIALVLDPWLPQPPTSDDDEWLVELAISIVATAINDIASRGHARLTLAIAGQSPECFGGAAAAPFCDDLLARLASIVPSDNYRLAAALSAAVEIAPRGARLIVISPRSASAASLESSQAELSLDPADLAWIHTHDKQLDSLFVLE